MLTLDALKKVVSKKNHNCLWCRKTIKQGEKHYWRKGRTSYYRYHISCVDNMVKDGRFDGLMAKDI